MLAHIWRWFPGWVQVQAEGGYPERLLNRMTAAEIPVWGVHRGQERISFCCFARDYRRLRRPARSACLRMRVRRKHGLPFRLRPYRHRKGLLVGLALYGILLALLSGRIWVVQVSGNTDTTSSDITAVTEELGVRIGARIAGLDIKNIQITGLSRLPTLAWITVNPSGCVAHVDVMERRPTPQVLDLTQPSDMVALRDGEILSVTVLSGQKAVKVGEAVRAGTVLISGRVDRMVAGGGTALQIGRAYGEVMARTQREITVTVPLVYEKTVPAGEPILRPTVTFLCWQFPLYASTDAPQPSRLWRQEHFLQGNGLVLPLGISNEYIIPLTAVRQTRTREQAQALASSRLERQRQTLFDGIEAEEIDRREVWHGNEVSLTATYRCVENIAAEVPMTPGAAAENGSQQESAD